MLNNKNIIAAFRVLSLFLIGVILIDLFFSQLSGSLSSYFDAHIPALASGGVLLLLLLMNPRYFSLNDDHEFIQIRSTSALWPFAENPAEVNFDIPKKNIGEFHITHRGLRSLITLELSTAYRGQSQYSFDISYLSGKKIAHLRRLVKQALKKPPGRRASRPMALNG